jgi:hypothetical protein
MAKIKIDGNKAYADGVRLIRKALPYYVHCRQIFYNEQIVVKVGDDGQNEIEYDIWKNVIERPDRKYFAPVLQYRDGVYLVQKRIRLRTGRRRSEHWELVQELCDRYNIADCAYRADNWCVDVDRNVPVIFDYGILR